MPSITEITAAAGHARCGEADVQVRHAARARALRGLPAQREAGAPRRRAALRPAETTPPGSIPSQRLKHASCTKRRRGARLVGAPGAVTALGRRDTRSSTPLAGEQPRTFVTSRVEPMPTIILRARLPPFTVRISPVMCPARSEQRKHDRPRILGARYAAQRIVRHDLRFPSARLLRIRRRRHLRIDQTRATQFTLNPARQLDRGSDLVTR